MDECSICLSEPIGLVKLNCSHTFCSECINKWIVVGNGCPICRRIIPLKINTNIWISACLEFLKIISYAVILIIVVAVVPFIIEKIFYAKDKFCWLCIPYLILLLILYSYWIFIKKRQERRDHYYNELRV
jgi:hypothetical protein